MKVIKSDRIVFFDCDDTLILWKKHDLDLPIIKINGREFQVHTKHLQKIKDYLIMEFQVIIWSTSGYKWAEIVAKSLGLQNTSIICMSKPHRIFDDVVDISYTLKHGYISL